MTGLEATRQFVDAGKSKVTNLRKVVYTFKKLDDVRTRAVIAGGHALGQWPKFGSLRDGAAEVAQHGQVDDVETIP